MEEKLQRLKTILGEVDDLSSASSLLHWDQQTYMPPGGTEDRGYQLGTLNRLGHQAFTSPEVGKLLDGLEEHVGDLDPESDEASLITVTRRLYDKRTKVPAEWVEEFSRTTTTAQQAWERAREQDNFAAFRPHLERIIDLRRKYVEFFAPYDHVYDVLLDDYEPGMKTAEVQAIFDALRPQQVALIQWISEQPQVDDSFLHSIFPEKDQWDFGMEVATKFGYDWNHGRLDRSAHPFTTNFGIGDVRITTRVMEDYVNSAMFSTMHEAGHALYEQGVSRDLMRTPLASGASLAVHESQSRMWENLVGRSYPFWEHFYPIALEKFPDALAGVSLDQFYRAINKVEPSLIRVEADEATYNLHVMLRLELEIALMEGKLEAADLPDAWKGRMMEYLGVEPHNDADGVLQDVHWSGGMFGYFSTYALGNLVSVQLWDEICKDIPDLDDRIRQADFQLLLDWLREKIHRHGSKFKPQDLVKRVTGSKIDPAPYVRYLNEKYRAIYGGGV